MCVATVVAYSPMSPIPSPINFDQVPYDLSWEDGMDVLPEGSLLLLATPSDGGTNRVVMLIAADDEKGGDEKADDKKDGDEGDKKDKEKDDEGGGWDRLWDAPKLG